MIVSINLNEERQKDFADMLSKEQRDSARRIMAQQLGQLLARNPAENLYWTESKTDLMELVYEVYVAENPVDRLGRPYSFSEMARRACAVLHVPMPKNPYAMVYNARERKGLKQKSFFSRYCWLMYCRHSRNPLYAMIRCMQ
ncbi:hypothetical protein [uncultured Prevotella sp.]|uniref:hypothetical protein n=1 Tax=uncultured Prevotella sp. TaxID=159272 RepID=UPI002609D169|nr:hypothetical protein [uncultured Prevotella sp.]